MEIDAGVCQSRICCRIQIFPNFKIERLSCYITRWPGHGSGAVGIAIEGSPGNRNASFISGNAIRIIIWVQPFVVFGDGILLTCIPVREVTAGTCSTPI